MKTLENIEKNKSGYNILPRRFSHKGWSFEQIDRKRNIALYSKTKEAFTTFELIEVQNRDAYEIAGNFVEAKECFPSDEQWGGFGWTYQTLEQAKKEFLRLTKKEKSVKR